MNSEAKETVLVIPDIQYPFAHQDHLAFLSAVQDRYEPTKVICIGDEVDFHALSDFTPDPDGMSPGDELLAALKCMRRLYRVFPEVVSLWSNHTSRPFRRAYKFGIPSALMKSYAEFMKAPKGWSWVEKAEIDGILYEHGTGCGGKMAHLKAALANMQSTVMGHLHSNAGVEWSANSKHLVFGMAVGSLVDDKAYAFAYGKDMKTKSILGCGVVQRGIPMFVPMLLAEGGRWVGSL